MIFGKFSSKPLFELICRVLIMKTLSYFFHKDWTRNSLFGDIFRSTNCFARKTNLSSPFEHIPTATISHERKRKFSVALPSCNSCLNKNPAEQRADMGKFDFHIHGELFHHPDRGPELKKILVGERYPHALSDNYILHLASLYVRSR